MIIFPFVANDTGRKILHSLDPMQVVFRGVPSKMKTKALIMMVKVFVAKACSSRLLCPSRAMQLDTVKAT